MFREKSIRVTWQSIYGNNVVRIWSLFKAVQHDAATNVALKIVCRRHVKCYRFSVQQCYVIVVKYRPMWHHLNPSLCFTREENVIKKSLKTHWVMKLLNFKRKQHALQLFNYLFFYIQIQYNNYSAMVKTQDSLIPSHRTARYN